MNTREIANKIKCITLEDAEQDFGKLTKMSLDACAVSDRCRIGNNVVDYFTFEQRLKTRGKYNVNFYEFIEQIEEFKKKKFIQNMLFYYETIKNKNKTKNQYIVLKEVFNICISAINIFRPLIAMEIYSKYQPKCILDPCAGWGGRAIGAAALNVPKYIGIEINTDLSESYENMKSFLSQKSTTNIDMHFCDALTIHYSELPPYDMVFTSPPYYLLEKYANNTIYENKEIMNSSFYVPLFEKTYAHLQQNGVYILNVNNDIYENVCLHVLGQADCIMPLKKSKRQNNYTENIYIWIKNK